MIYIHFPVWLGWIHASRRSLFTTKYVLSCMIIHSYLIYQSINQSINQWITHAELNFLPSLTYTLFTSFNCYELNISDKISVFNRYRVLLNVWFFMRDFQIRFRLKKFADLWHYYSIYHQEIILFTIKEQCFCWHAIFCYFPKCLFSIIRACVATMHYCCWNYESVFGDRLSCHGIIQRFCDVLYRSIS